MAMEKTHHFNTAIASAMELLNEVFEYASSMRAQNSKRIFSEVIKNLLLLLSPFAPHVTDELWSMIGLGGFVIEQEWPKCNDAFLERKEMNIAVQVNGKLRANFTTEKDTPKDAIISEALEIENVAKHVNGEPKKVIYVPGRILNIVV